MSRLHLSLALAAAGTLAAAAPAHAQHDVRAYLSPEGLDFVAAQLPSYVPTTLAPPTMQKSFGCMDFIQRDTVIEIQVQYLDISVPEPGRLRVELQIGGQADGEIHADDIYACVGSQTCSDHLTIDQARAVIDYEIMVEGGHPRVMAREISLDVEPSDVQLQFADCGFVDDVLNNATQFAEGKLLEFLENKVEEIAHDKLGVALEDVLGGFAYSGSIGSTDFEIALDSLALETDGITVGVDADIWTTVPAAECIADGDPGDPGDHDGAVPDLAIGSPSQVGFAINLGLIDDGIYHVWRRGLTCLTDQHLTALGIDLDTEHLLALIPGFPPGTEVAIELRLASPPRVVAAEGDGAAMTMVVEGLELDITGNRPDGTTNTLSVELDMQGTAVMGIDPTSNAMMASMGGAEITRLVMEDERTATGAGFDVGRVIQLAEDVIIPKVSAEIGEIAITAPIFTFAGYAILLREMNTQEGYLTLGADLFRIPTDDSNAPETTLVFQPNGVVSPDRAKLLFGGRDGEIPAELLRYKVTVDGVEQTLSFVRQIHIGEVGVTRSYEVSVTAIDLNENEDPTPIEATIEVDGIAPALSVDGARSRLGDGTTTETVEWTMSDDRTAEGALAVRVEVYRLVDPADAFTAELVDTQELAAGATRTDVLVETGGVYRIVVHAVDEAGNDSSSTLLLEIPTVGCGCSSTGAGAGGWLLLALAAPLMLRRRRRAA